MISMQAYRRTWFTRAALRSQAGIDSGSGGGVCVRRHATRNRISAPITRPVDLWKLMTAARGGAPSGIISRYQPNTICASTAKAISQCSVIAVRVSRMGRGFMHLVTHPTLELTIPVQKEDTMTQRNVDRPQFPQPVE